MTKFITVDEAKIELKITVNTYDDRIDSLIEDVSAEIQGWTGRTIESTTFSETQDIGYLQRAVFLEEYPIISIAGCTSNGVAMVEGTDYSAKYKTGVLIKKEVDQISVLDYVKDYWYEGTDKFEITYTAGYTTIPDAIKRATKMLVKRNYYDSGAGDVKSRSMGDEHVERFPMHDGMPENVYNLLHPYRSSFA